MYIIIKVYCSGLCEANHSYAIVANIICQIEGRHWHEWTPTLLPYFEGLCVGYLVEAVALA